jgi:hypothetical protein
LVQFDYLSSGGVVATGVLVRLNTFEKIKNGLLLNLIETFTYFFCKFGKNLIRSATEVDTLVLSKALEQTRSYLDRELIKLFVSKKVLSKLIKQGGVTDHVNILSAQFVEHLLDLVDWFDEGWVFNCFVDSFYDSE